VLADADRNEAADVVPGAGRRDMGRNLAQDPLANRFSVQ
jgi:hypothetical protein